MTSITYHGRVLGVLNVFTEKKKDFSSEDLWVMDILAQHSGIAIHHSMDYERMKEMAMVDTVTGAFSRRYFYSKAEEQLAQVRRIGGLLSVLMVDVDHFKKVNDTFGHQTGDQILRQLTLAIENSIRISDVCGRYGGEEFAVLLPNISSTKAVKIAERLREKVANKTDPTVTVSIGISSLLASDTSIDDLIKRADEALYESKENGRNQVSVKTDLPLVRE